MYYITCDIDWAPEEVIYDFLSLLEEHQVKCTLFATHDSKILRELNSPLFEVGLHPNYNNLLNGTAKESRLDVLKKLKDLYPSAKGIRSHSLTQNSNMLQDFVDEGIVYDVNQFLPYSKLQGPYKWFNGLVRIAYNWEDDVHFMYNKSFSSLELNKEDEYNILDFHPIHTFLNTDSYATYERARNYYQEPKELIKLRNTSVKGTRDIFIDTLKQIKSTQTMFELATSI